MLDGRFDPEFYRALAAARRHMPRDRADLGATLRGWLAALTAPLTRRQRT